MCQHQPPCPPAGCTDHEAARVIARHPEQGWSLLCNGVVLFDDTGELLPDGRIIPPHRPTDPPHWADSVSAAPRHASTEVGRHLPPFAWGGRPPMAAPARNGAQSADRDEDLASFRVEQMQGCAVVHAVGEIDLSTSGALGEAVGAAAELSSRVIVDLTQVALIDSTGLSVLVEAHAHAGANGGVVALVGPGRLVRTVLEITRLSEAFPIYRELQDAVVALT